MPIAKIQGPDGRVFTLEVPEGATQEQILGFVQSQQSQTQPVTAIVQPAQTPQQEQEPSTLDSIGGALDVGGSILSSAIAEPVAGVVGGLEAAGRGLLNFIGVDAGDAVGEGVQTINTIKDFLTADIDSDEGKNQAQALGEFIAPAAEGFKKVESALGNTVLEVTGSPALAAVAHSLPTAVLEGFGLKGLRGAKALKGEKLSGNIGKAIQQAAPDIDTIRQAKTAAYNELDNLGIRVNSKTYDNFADKLTARLTKEGIDPTLTPKSSAVLKRIVDDKGAPKSLQELDTIRKIARGAANDIDKTDARLGSMIINDLDSGIDQLSKSIGSKFKEARGLAQRGFKSQDVTDMIESASLTASGMENGLRIEARKLLKKINSGKSKGYTPDEVSALKQVVQGTGAANTAKFLGKFGISEGQATSMLGVSIGAGGGGTIGTMLGGGTGGIVGALTVPAIGQIAKKTAQKLTSNSVKFADDLARSGKNAKKITRAYLKHTPVKDRNVSDLTDLLLQEGVDLASIKSLPKSASKTNKLVSDAKFFAEGIKRKGKQAGSAALITRPGVDTEEPVLDFIISGGNKSKGNAP